MRWIGENVIDYLGGQTPEELEALLRRLITQGAEGPKVDFKSAFSLGEKLAQAELAKDLSSIANTDDDAHLGDFGYIILGAERGRLVGAVEELEGDADKLQARLTDVIKLYVGPVPHFSLCVFDDPVLGRWGAIVIPPSSRQPHIFVRDGASEVVKHEWWVRVNDTKERAGPHDYARIFAKATRREVRPLELELQRLALKVDQREPPNMDELVAAIRGSSHETIERQEGAGGADLVSSIRRFLVRGSQAMEDSLAAEALRVAGIMAEDSECNPVLFSSMKQERLLGVLGYLEEQTFPLAEALATIARYDHDSVLVDAVARSLRIVAREPQPLGTHYTNITQFRLYPLVLCLYAVTIVAVAEQRAALLSAILSVRLEFEGRDRIEPVIVSLRRIRAASDVFKVALGKDYFEPVAVRIRDVLVPRLSAVLAGTPSKDAFHVAEFVLGLSFLTVSGNMHHGRVPMPGCYFYDPDAQRPLKRFLARRPTWLNEVLGESLETILPAFDESAPKVVTRQGWADGFVSGAAEAYGLAGAKS